MRTLSRSGLYRVFINDVNMYLQDRKVKLRKDFNKCVDTFSYLGAVYLAYIGFRHWSMILLTLKGLLRTRFAYRTKQKPEAVGRGSIVLINSLQLGVAYLYLPL